MFFKALRYFSVFFTTKSIPELLAFCLDIDCNVRDGGILPTSMCQSCMDKLRIAFELKTKSKESDKYLKQILQSSNPEPMTMIPMIPMLQADNQSYYPDDDEEEEESLLEPINDDTDETKRRSRGNRSGMFVCKICAKEFKYAKPFNNHMKQHKQNRLTKSGATRTYALKKKILPPVAQPPYDSQSPYASPAYYKADSSRESSPDFGATLIGASNFINSNEPPTKKTRRKQILPSKSPSREPSPTYQVDTTRSGRIRTSVTRPSKIETLKSPNETLSASESEEMEETKSSRGRPRKTQTDVEINLIAEISQETPVRSRGRPRKSVATEEKTVDGSENGADEMSHDSLLVEKKSRGRPRKTPREDKTNDVIDETNDGFLEGFREVDVNLVLKANSLSFMADESASQSAHSSNRGRSRSSSVEVIPDYDIFGTAIADSPKKQPQKASSGLSFICDQIGCSSKFHLRANLMKHQREVHGKRK